MLKRMITFKEIYMIIFERELLLASLLSFMEKINLSGKIVETTYFPSLRKNSYVNNPYFFLLIASNHQLSLINTLRALPWPESRECLLAVKVRLLEVYGALLHLEDPEEFINENCTLPLLIESIVDLYKDLINRGIYSYKSHLKDLKERLVKLALLPPMVRESSLEKFSGGKVDTLKTSKHSRLKIRSYKNKAITFPIPEHDYGTPYNLVVLNAEHRLSELKSIPIAIESTGNFF